MRYTPIDIEFLRQYLEIDDNIPQKFRWKKRPSNRVKVGDPVGRVNKDKNNRVYYYFTLKGQSYLTHRVYFAFKNGFDPGKNDIDHKNHDYKDNIVLRMSTRSQNIANSRPKDKKYKGIWYVKSVKKYRAAITVNYKAIHLGYFFTEKEAALAYNEAAKKYFGEFACLNIIPHTHDLLLKQNPNPRGK